MAPHEMQVIYLNNAADHLRKQGETERALSLFEQAMKLIAAYDSTPKTKVAVYSNFGILLVSLGEYGKAIQLQQKALELDKLRGIPSDLGFSYHNLGHALVAGGNLVSGIEHLEKAREIRQSIQDYSELLITLEALSNTYLTNAQIEKAKDSAEQGRALESNLGRTPDLRGVTAVLAQIAAREGNWDKACTLQAEIVEFLEKLRQSHSGLTRLDRFDSRYNKHYLSGIELLLEAKRYHAALALIDQTRFRSGCDVLEGIRVFDSPLKDKALKIPVVAERELILVEWIYPRYDWSFPISKQQSKIIVPKKIITSTSEEPPFKLDLKTEWHKHFQNTLRQTQCVIDAYQDDLEKAKRIVFIPHGTQWQTPFSALRHPKTKDLLLRTHELLLSPSLRFCRITDNRPKVRSRRYLVVGDPTSDLPHSRKEAQQVANKLGCTPLLGSEATREEFLRMLSEREYDIIHFAGHGSYSDDGLHALILSDGPVTVDDIMSKKLSANIVNLTSCWGGMTTFSVWNELYGFVRALLISGTRSVIGSIYPVGDEAALLFSTTFYDQYLKSLNHAKAFQEAVASIPAYIPVEDWGGLCITGQR
jgi:hypothetical protein